jgi:branched-chain amino acid transport system permease protein
MSSILLQVIVGGCCSARSMALFSSGLTLIWGMMNIVNFAMAFRHARQCMWRLWCGRLLGVGPFVAAPAAALLLATLGIIVYFGLIRSVMKGPMLAADPRHLRPGAAVTLFRFWVSAPIFLTLPENLVGGTYDVLGISIQAVASCLRASVAPAGDARLHLLLTRTSLGSKNARGRRRCYRGAADGHPSRLACRRSPGRSQAGGRPASPAR